MNKADKPGTHLVVWRRVGRSLPSFKLMINLKTAKALGLTIPPGVVARAMKFSSKPECGRLRPRHVAS